MDDWGRAMLRLFRASCAAGLLLFGAASLASCQRQGASEAEAPAGPSNADREEELAAAQLAALGGQANAQQRALFEGDFQASGDVGGGEGAWELFLLADYAQFARPGLGEDGGIAGERAYRERGLRVVAGPLTITISNEICQASSGELPYTAQVLFEGVSYQGCARRGISEGERPTWASVLPDLIPAIDACLSHRTSRSARVTFAAVIDEGAVSVRLRGADGARTECIADVSGQVTVFETLSDLDRRNGEGDPEFLRNGAAPRAGNCRVVEPALGANGEELGWLIRRTC